MKNRLISSASSHERERKIKCPQCRRDTIFSQENVHRPFCSERCKMIDLGTWAEENYRIPVQDAAMAQGDWISEDEKNN